MLSQCLYLCLNSLQVSDNTHLVVLSKEEGSGLGFSIAGGVDLEQKAITVSIEIQEFTAAKSDICKFYTESPV